MIVEFLQSIDSRLDSNNVAAIVFSANSVKCNNPDDYWGVTTQTLDETEPKAIYFGSPSSDSLNYESVSINQVNTSMSSIEGVRHAMYDLFKRADSDVLFLVSTNSEGWTARTMELFKEHNVIPSKKEIVFISLANIHRLNTEQGYAAMMDNNATADDLGKDIAVSRKLSLNKLIDIYHVTRHSVCTNNEYRCRAIWEIMSELITHLMKNHEEL